MKTLKVVVRPRLHLGLISMHKGGIRKNGGIGFSVQKPCGTLSMSKSGTFSFEDQRTIPLDAVEARQLHDMVESVSKKYSLDPRVHVTLDGDLRTHVGMGSGTVIRLGVLEGLFRANERRISMAELIRISKRGGTSGIGINAYFSGGMVLDLGVPNNNDEFVPSSLAIEPLVPCSFPIVEMPDWPLCVCVPRAVPTKSQHEEIEFFARATPISAVESYKAAYEAIFGVYAAVVERDFGAFCKSVVALQKTKWKLQEWKEYGSDLRDIETKLRELGAAAVGMSSLGPMLYCFGERSILENISREMKMLNCCVTLTMPHNSGREILFE